MDGFIQFVAIALLIVSVLLIIKFWEMADNIKAIHNLLSSGDFFHTNMQMQVSSHESELNNKTVVELSKYDKHEDDYGKINEGDKVVHKNMKGYVLTVDNIINDKEALCSFDDGHTAVFFINCLRKK